MAAAGELNPAEQATWYKFVTDFDAVKSAFDANYGALLQLGPQIDRYPGLRPAWEKLVNEGADQHNTMLRLQATRDFAASWLNWLSSGAQGVFKFLGLSGADGLGIGPLAIALYSAGAAIVAVEGVKYWMAGSYAIAQRLNQQMAIADARIARGEDPATAFTNAARDVNGMMGPPSQGLFADLGSLAMWLAIGAAVLFLAPPLLKSLESPSSSRRR